MIARFLLDDVMHPQAVQALHSGTGVLLALQAVLLLPDLPLLYGTNGLVDPALLHRSGVATAQLTVLYAVVYAMLALLLACRCLPWWGILLLALLHHAWFLDDPSFSYGADYLSASALFYCLCTCRPLRAWHTPALRLLQLHLCIVYFFSGLAKAMGPTWRNGAAVWKAANQPYHLDQAPSFIASLGHFPALWAVAGCSVVILEIGYSCFVWVPAVRPYWLGGIVAMHIGIALLMGLFHFAAVMILLNLVAFYYAYRPVVSQPVYSPHTPSPGGAPARKLRLPLRDDTTKGGTTNT